MLHTRLNRAFHSVFLLVSDNNLDNFCIVCTQAAFLLSKSERLSVISRYFFRYFASFVPNLRHAKRAIFLRSYTYEVHRCKFIPSRVAREEQTNSEAARSGCSSRGANVESLRLLRLVETAVGAAVVGRLRQRVVAHLDDAHGSSLRQNGLQPLAFDRQVYNGLL